MRRNRNKTDSKKIEYWISVIALVIALIGGVPGVIGIINYFERSVIKINFDSQQSLACKINSMNSNINGKAAILLYRISVIGKGIQNAYLKDIVLEIKTKNGWVKGKQFSPKQIDKIDTTSNDTFKAVHIRVTKPNGWANIWLMEWHDFRPTQKGIEYGEPSSFSYAAYFDIDPVEFGMYDELRIFAYDYLGNIYDEIINLADLMKWYPRYILFEKY